MLTANEILDMTPIGMVFTVIKTPADTNGETLEMEWTLLPHCDGTPVHVHPSAKESYTVLEGSLEVNINNKWKQLTTGESVTIAEGTPHTFRNPSGNVTRVYNTHSPALQIDAYFEDLNKVVHKLSHGSSTPLKMNMNAATHLCMLMKKYKVEIVSKNPPGFVVSLLNIIGKVRGLKV